MTKLCAALNCVPEDLIIPTEFQYDEFVKNIILRMMIFREHLRM